MRVGCLLLAAVATLASFSAAVSTTNHVSTSTLATANALLHPVHPRRLLRAGDAFEEVDEERATNTAEIDGWLSKLLDKGKNLFATLDDMKAHLGLDELKALETKLAKREHAVLKGLVTEGETPKTLYKQLGIKERLKKTPEELELDDNYQLFVAFQKYWNTNTSWLKKLIQGKKIPRKEALEQ